MNKDKYPMYGIALIAGAALAVWAGLPVSVLLFLLVCPLMMFFMMRGMHGGQGHGGRDDSSDTRSETPPRSDRGPSRHPDGSHERIDQP